MSYLSSGLSMLGGALVSGCATTYGLVIGSAIGYQRGVDEEKSGSSSVSAQKIKGVQYGLLTGGILGCMASTVPVILSDSCSYPLKCGMLIAAPVVTALVVDILSISYMEEGLFVMNTQKMLPNQNLGEKFKIALDRSFLKSAGSAILGVALSFGFDSLKAPSLGVAVGVCGTYLSGLGAARYEAHKRGLTM